MDGQYIGQKQKGCLPDHRHTVSAYNHWNGGGTSYFYQEDGNVLVTLNTTYASASNSMYGNGWFSGDRVVPASLGVPFIIRY